jgi:hypothetical protein
MSTDKQSGKGSYNYLFVTLLILSVFFVQYIFRYADDNRLTSWQWVFANIDLKFFVPVLILGIIPAYILSRFSFPQLRPAMFLFLLSFTVSIIFWGEPEVIVDTSRYFTHAKHLEIYGIKYFIQEWGQGINAWTDMPLISFFYGLIFKFFGESRIYIQIFTTFLFSITCVTTFFIGKTLWNEDVGFLAGSLLLGIPYLFSQIPLMLTDVPAMFFLTLSIYTFIKTMEKGSIWIFISSAAIFCAVLSKYSAWMMLSVLPVIFIVYLIEEVQKSDNPPVAPLYLKGGWGGYSRHQIRNLVYRSISIAFIAGSLIAIVVILKFDVIDHQMKFLREYQAPGLKRWGESFVSTFLFQIHPLIFLAAAYSGYEAFKKRDLKFLIIFWLILLVILLQIRRSRYIMVIFPMLTLMASYGMQKIKNIELRRFVAFSIISSSIVVAIMAYLPFLQRMSMVNLKNAGSYLDSVKTERIEVFTVPSTETIVNVAVAVPVLDLYTEKDIYYLHDETYAPPFEEIKESPLRFTWEYKNPKYYTTPIYPPLVRRELKGDTAFVVISNGNVKSLPDYVAERSKDYWGKKVFDISDGVFGFSPVVTVYFPSNDKP